MVGTKCCPPPYECLESASCVEGLCKGDLGWLCYDGDWECSAGLCLPSGICSQACGSDVDCPPGPEWWCAPGDGGTAGVCQCAPTGTEICDGHDNDCNGVVDGDNWKLGLCGPGEACQEDACACLPANVCADGCKDLQHDTQNCGGCGVVCAGTCAFGRCAIELASAGGPTSLAIDATHVFWADFQDGAVKKVPVTGGATSVVAGGQGWVTRVAVRGASLYWTANPGTTSSSSGGSSSSSSSSSGGFSSNSSSTSSGVFPGACPGGSSSSSGAPAGFLRRAPTSGGAGVNLGSHPLGAGDLALSPTDAFWLATGYGYPGEDVLFRVAGSATTSTPVECGLSSPVGLLADATHVYWVNQTSPTVLILRAPAAGGTASVMATVAGSVGGLAIDATHLYWSESMWGGVGGLWRVPLAGGAPETVPGGEYIAGMIAIDGVHVYWESTGQPWPGGLEGGIFRRPLAGGPTEQLTGGWPTSFAVDTTSIYWIEGHDLQSGRVMKASPK